LKRPLAFLLAAFFVFLLRSPISPGTDLTLPELSSTWKDGLSIAWAGYIGVLSVWILLQKRAPVSTVSWILSLALIPFAGFAVYYFLGPQRLKKQRQRRLRHRAGANAQADLARLRDAAEAAPSELRQLAQLGAATCGLPVSSATRVELLSGGANTFDSIFRAIQAAHHHVHLEYYIYEPDKIGTALRDLLIERARAGVKIRLLLDALGSKNIGHAFTLPMCEAGIQVLLFHDTRIGRRLRPVTNYRTHRKIVVCDGRVGFTGGVNITDEEDTRTRSDAYHDVHLRIEGSAVRWLQTTFLEDWTYAAGEDSEEAKQARDQLDALLPQVEAGTIPVQVVASGPDTPLEPIHRMHVAAINGATKRAWLTTPYFVPTEAALQSLTSAALRGADVRVLVPRRSDSFIVSAAARSYYDDLLSAGVKIWEYKARMLHSKTLLVDDDCAIVGTANFDNRSFRLNFEVCAVVYGDALAKPLAEQFEIDLKSAVAVKEDRHRKFLPRLGEATAKVFSPLL
jgi:cardiolipin synthase A/B